MQGVMKKKALWLLAVLLLIAVTFFAFRPGTIDLDKKLPARIYSVDDPTFAGEGSVSMEGKWKKGLNAVQFTGKLAFSQPDIVPEDAENAKLIFRDNVCTPVFSTVEGMVLPSAIHSFILDREGKGLIAVLYSEYEEKNNAGTARFNREHFCFICIGDIDRDKAIELIYSHI